MGEWVRSALDIILILMVGAGLYQAARLIRHLAGLRQGRVEMERFVHEFNATVIRAEAGIKGLRNAARESGDDLEKLVEKATLLRDELGYIVESADQLADRLSQTATNVARSESSRSDKKAEPTKAASETSTAATPSPVVTMRPAESKDNPSASSSSAPSSRAEKELLQALQKLN